MKSLMRYFLLAAAFLLSACTFRPAEPQKPQELPMTPAESGDIIGENEAMPETIESLEVGKDEQEPALPTSEGASGTVIIGNPSTPLLTIVTDISCTYCRTFAVQYLPWVMDEYVATDKVALEFVFLPMNAEGIFSAKTLLCAQDQHLFDAAHAELRLSLLTSPKELPALAKKIGANATMLAKCVAGKEVTAVLEEHKEKAAMLGISRVPGFSLNGHTWLGVATWEGLKEEIEKGL